MLWGYPFQRIIAEPTAAICLRTDAFFQADHSAGFCGAASGTVATARFYVFSKQHDVASKEQLIGVLYTNLPLFSILISKHFQGNSGEENPGNQCSNRRDQEGLGKMKPCQSADLGGQVFGNRGIPVEQP